MIVKREKRKKIFYVPGMISLILIPLFCFYHFYKVGAFKVFGVLDISLVPDKEEFEKYKVKDLRKYRDFIFNGDKTQELKLQELRYFVRDLVKKYDTVNGAKIHFGSKTDYNTFVNVIDILKVEEVPTWAPYKDDIYVLASAKPKPKKDRRFFCGTPKYSRENTIRIAEEVKRKELDVFQLSFLKQQWGIFVGYLGIVLLSIFMLVKFNKTR
ncbi:hypothetical protein Flavo103_15310 [Flavobacterium collinsii]|uniref:Uncharacterized protein n=2 Tax=Flavobacterium collinsii TaxID=1114861 RepID=A0ABN7EJV4_9FLAO|nr:hypothetical protein Flavo103_15310 [Flavobacterium collinsii]CAA9196751.1 hypothetical protein FLACOL7796_01323 [Flavobacterium collinsii]